MLQESDHALLTELAARLRARYASAGIWAFGSRVRGEATWESDLDVCVVLEELTPEIRTAISHVAWEVGFEHDVVISTVVFSREMFEHGPASVSPLVRTIREEGVAA